MSKSAGSISVGIQVWIPSTHVKNWSWLQVPLDSSFGYRDGQVLRVFWPASLDQLQVSGLIRTWFQGYNIVSDRWINLKSCLGLCLCMLGHTHHTLMNVHPSQTTHTRAVYNDNSNQDHELQSIGCLLSHPSRNSYLLNIHNLRTSEYHSVVMWHGDLSVGLPCLLASRLGYSISGKGVLKILGLMLCPWWSWSGP